MMSKGILRDIHVKTGETYTVPFKTRILILSGLVHHITGTDSEVKFLRKPKVPNLIADSIVLSATANGDYSLFNTSSAETQAQFPMIIMDDKNTITMAGGVGSYVNLLVIEWDIP